MFQEYDSKTRTGNWEEEKALEEQASSEARIIKDDGKSKTRTIGTSGGAKLETTTTYRASHVDPRSVKSCQPPYEMVGARSKAELQALKAIVDREFIEAESKASNESLEMAKMSQSHENYQAAPLELYLEARNAKIKGSKKEYVKPLDPVQGKYTEGRAVTIYEQSLDDPSTIFPASFKNGANPFGRSSMFSHDIRDGRRENCESHEFIASQKLNE